MKGTVPIQRLTRVSFLLFLLSPTIVEAEVGAPEWQRIGLEWVLRPRPPEIVDINRVAEQRERGCIASELHFGDTALMRGTLSAPNWAARQTFFAIAASAFADDQAVAEQALATARRLESDNPRAAAVVDTLVALSALQFADPIAAEARLSALRELGDLPAPLRADILFWSAVSAASRADVSTWAGPIDTWLSEAMLADPTSVQVRVYRVLSWLNGRMWEGGPRDCSERARAFSDRLLDLTEIGACRLMVGHLDFAIQRSLGARLEHQTDAELALWQGYTHGFLAGLVGARAAASVAQLELAESGGHCAAVLAEGLSALVDAEIGDP